MAFLKNSWGALAIVLMTGLLNCQPRPKPAQVSDASRDTLDTSMVLDQLEILGSIAYDHPEQFVNNPDSFLNQLTTMPITVEGKEMYAWLLLNIAYALRENGNVLGSTRYYEMAMTYCTNHRLMEPEFVSYIAKPLGNLYTQIGDLQKALHIHRLAITHLKKQKEESQLPALYGNMAIIYQQAGLPDSVLLACANGLSYVRKNDVHAALLYNTIARSHQDLGNLDSARHYNRMALALFSNRPLQGDTLIWYTSALHQQSFLQARDGHQPQALQSINRAIALAEDSFPATKQREKAKYYYERANLYLIQQQFDRSREDFQQTLRLFSTAPVSLRLYPDYTFTDALWGVARTYVDVQPDSMIYYYTKTIENAYYTQQLIVSNKSHYQNSAWNRSLLHEAMTYLWRAYQRKPDEASRQSLAKKMLWITELSKGRQLLQEINRSSQWAEADSLHENLRRRLQLIFQTLAEEQHPERKHRLQREADELTFALQLTENHFEQSFAPPDFDAFNRRITAASDSVTVVSYFVSASGETYCTSLANHQVTVALLTSDTLAELPHFIATYFGTSPVAYENDPNLYRKLASQLTTKLLPVVSTSPHDRMVISADGPLLTLPFDALIHQEDFLAQHKNIHYTYTLLLPMQDARRQIYRPTMTVFAQTHYRDEKLPDLPFVATEIDYLTRHFHANSYLDTAANDGSFFKALAAGRLIHLAAHAIADGEHGPYIALNQPLTLDQIRYVPAASPLIFLAACETASGHLLPGEGMESLNKAFLSKGIKGVVASYWAVDDATSPLLTRLFYEALAETHQPSVALAIAKRRYLATVSTGAQNPWYWSSFQFTGTDTILYLDQRPPWRQPLLLLALTAAVCGIGWWFLRASKRPFHRKHHKAE